MVRWDQRGKPLPPKRPDATFKPLKRKPRDLKRAPKPRVPRTVQGVQTAAAGVALEVVDADAMPPQQLRRAAYLKYVTEPDLSVEAMHGQPPFDGVTLSTLRHWCVVDGWAEGRRQQYEGIKAAVMKHVATAAVANHLDTLAQVKVLKDRLLTKLAAATFDRTDEDKLVKSYCLVVETEIRLLGLTGGVLTPPKPERDPAEREVQGGSQLTDEEARVVALALLRHKRERDGDGDERAQDQVAETTPAGPKPKG